jgi:uncharacterized coiled-coil protein SlyX
MVGWNDDHQGEVMSEMTIEERLTALEARVSGIEKALRDSASQMDTIYNLDFAGHPVESLKTLLTTLRRAMLQMKNLGVTHK